MLPLEGRVFFFFLDIDDAVRYTRNGYEVMQRFERSKAVCEVIDKVVARNPMFGGLRGDGKDQPADSIILALKCHSK